MSPRPSRPARSAGLEWSQDSSRSADADDGDLLARRGGPGNIPIYGLEPWPSWHDQPVSPRPSRPARSAGLEWSQDSSRSADADDGDLLARRGQPGRCEGREGPETPSAGAGARKPRPWGESPLGKWRPALGEAHRGGGFQPALARPPGAAGPAPPRGADGMGGGSRVGVGVMPRWPWFETIDRDVHGPPKAPAAREDRRSCRGLTALSCQWGQSGGVEAEAEESPPLLASQP